MPSAPRIRELLPSLWRPEPEAAADDLLALFVNAAGSLIDTASIAAGEVMQAHWFRYADSALVSPYVARLRAKAGAPPLRPGDPEVDLHPYLDDLARLAGILGLAPWREPLAERETVEEFRRRIARMVALYRDGLAPARRSARITLASLPVADRAAPPGLRERGFTVEEAAPAAARRSPRDAARHPRRPRRPADALAHRQRRDRPDRARDLYRGRDPGAGRDRSRPTSRSSSASIPRPAPASASPMRARCRPARPWRSCPPSPPGSAATPAS